MNALHWKIYGIHRDITLKQERVLENKTYKGHRNMGQ
jgi:hypothetical protein